ncbi:MAG: nitroreductase family deazaflavin-dependent oxidoreductase [Thermomicrobiales bacterium]|nr:nitroreductase family deazaflavin-dependent oxidoreductase [Thermomicrobiales bacterium]
MSSMPTFERDRPNRLLRLAFKLPPKIYAGPIARGLASRCVMKLTTTGRRSGLPRTICISFMPHEDGYVIFSGFGVGSNWYQNLLADPHVDIRVGSTAMKATGSVVEDPEERKALMLEMQERSKACGPPPFIRPVLRFFRAFDYDAEIQMAVDEAEALPVVQLRPTSQTS